MLARVRDSYRRMAQQPDWTLLDGELSKDAIAEQVMAAVLAKLPART